MRWPFRRRRTTAAPSATPEKAGSGAPAAGAPATRATASGAPVPGVRHWAALPVIPVTIKRGAPLVVGPPPVLPPLRPAARSAATPEVAPAVGAVTGIVQPVPVPVAEPVVEAPAPPLPPAPVVRRPVRTAPVEAPPVLTDAVDEYIGEPREALEPYRAPSWLRYASNPGLPMLPGLPEPEQPITEPPSFLPPELRSAPKPPPEPVQATEPPPRMVEGVERAEAPEQRPMRKRRPNLGQTRRLGLGAPIPAPEKEALVHPEAPPRVVDGAVEPAMPQEPPPPPAAPVRVAPEPEPAPRAVRPNPPDGQAAEKPTVTGSYRATADLLPPRTPRPRQRATVVDAVPADLANAIRARQHADVSDVPVYRGPAVDEAAKARGAKAFASGGAVFLPGEAGPVDSPKARGVLAHELVHAVQQRTLGPVLPSPDSPLGQRLEAEAQTAERFYGGESGAEEPAPLIHAPQPAAPQQVEPDLTAPAQLLTTPAQAPAPAPAPQPVQSPFDSATKAEVGRIAEESARHVVTEWSNPKLEPKQGTTSGSATTPQTQQRPAFDRVARKEALVRQTLEVINQERFDQGREPLTDLDAMHYERIERQLDEEQGGTTSTVPTTPQRPSYRPNSKEAWLAGLTGQDPSQGLGIGGLLAKPGSEKSWFQGSPKDDRPLAQRLMTGLGLANENSASQFDPDSWFSDEPEQQTGAAAGTQDAAAQRQGTGQSGSGSSTTDEEHIPVSRLDLDELSDRLYDRLRSRLRLELLVDRERAGLLTDFR